MVCGTQIFCVVQRQDIKAEDLEISFRLQDNPGLVSHWWRPLWSDHRIKILSLYSESSSTRLHFTFHPSGSWRKHIYSQTELFSSRCVHLCHCALFMIFYLPQNALSTLPILPSTACPSPCISISLHASLKTSSRNHAFHESLPAWHHHHQLYPGWKGSLLSNVTVMISFSPVEVPLSTMYL